MKDGKLMGISDSFKASKDDMTHTHEDGTTHSHGVVINRTHMIKKHQTLRR